MPGEQVSQATLLWSEHGPICSRRLQSSLWPPPNPAAMGWWGEMVNASTFRQDLYYRINAFTLRLPALRERVEDLPLLIESLLRRGARGKQWQVAPEAMAWLCAYPCQAISGHCAMYWSGRSCWPAMA